MTARPAIRIEGATFSYPNQDAPSLRDVDLEVMPGECVVVTGPSGCGKTTLTRLVNGLVPHAYDGELSGRVLVNGRDVADWTSDELGVEVGSVFQNPRSQFVNLDVLSEVAFGCESLGLPREEIACRVTQAASALGVDGLLDRSIDALSGGQRQSVVLASAYAMHPDVFVLDEPTASLDIDSMRRLAKVVSRLKAQGKTVLVSEHRLWWLEGIADRVIAMEDGALAAQWTAEEFGVLSVEERRRRGLRAWSEREAFGSAAGARQAYGSGGARQACAQGVGDAGAPLLSARSLSVGYKRKAPVLQGLDIDLPRDRIVGLVGENGAGKTTLLRCLCGLAKESGGTVAVEGKALKPKHRPTRVHLVMQEPGYQLFADSVFGEAVSACDGDDPEGDARRMLDAFGLLPFEERHPLSLSGGERQRLSIAVGLLRGCPVMLLDEPTSGLDYRNMRRVADALRKAADAGCAVCVVTHDFEFLCETCDDVAEVTGGRALPSHPIGSPAGMEVIERLAFRAD